MPTYVYLAHGSECSTTLNKNNLKRIPNRRNIIPKGCTLSTITESGVESQLSDMARLVRIATVPETRQYMIHPVEHYDTLSILLSGLDNEFLRSIPEYKRLSNEGYLYTNVAKSHKTEYHLKTEGEVYSERSFEFLFVNDLKVNLIKIYRSGLYDIERNDYPPLTDTIFIEASQTLANVPISDFLKIFEGSVYPTQEQILEKVGSKQVLSFWDIADSILQFKKSQSELLEEFTGNHYNFSCRSYKNEINEETRKLVRRNSLASIQYRARPLYNKKLEEYKAKRNAFNRARPSLDLLVFRLNMQVKKEKIDQRVKDTVNKDIDNLIAYINEDTLIEKEDALKLKESISILIQREVINTEKEGFARLMSSLEKASLTEGGRRKPQKTRRRCATRKH